MGAADVVPGVSGGTIAYLTGIYETLLHAIKSFDGRLLSLLLQKEWKLALQRINWTFLFPLLSGILLSIFSLAKLIIFFLIQYPDLLWGFFFGLILSSTGIMARKLTILSLPLFLAGGLIAWLCSSMQANEAAHDFLQIFVAGFIALCAMILPGISGSFILVLMGQYSHVLQAVVSLDIATLCVFAAGGICGLLSFSHALSACFKHFPNMTNAAMIGIMAGCLRLVWPWKNAGAPYFPSSFGMAESMVCALAAIGFLLPAALSFVSMKTEHATAERFYE